MTCCAYGGCLCLGAERALDHFPPFKRVKRVCQAAEDCTPVLL